MALNNWKKDQLHTDKTDIEAVTDELRARGMDAETMAHHVDTTGRDLLRQAVNGDLETQVRFLIESLGCAPKDIFEACHHNLDSPLPYSSELDWHLEEEWFRFIGTRFDVRRAKQLIVERPRFVELMDPEPCRPYIDFPDEDGKPLIHIPIDFARLEGWGENEGTFPFPVITAQLEEGRIVIDGWHRAAKALMQGDEKIPAVALTEEESKEVQS